MGKQIFKNVNYKSDPHCLVKNFFNSIYQRNNFLLVLSLLVEKKRYTINEEFCFFPDLTDPDPVYHFSGVMFGLMNEEVIITEEQSNLYLKEACERYLEENPDDRIQLNALFNMI